MGTKRFNHLIRAIEILKLLNRPVRNRTQGGVRGRLAN